MTGYNIEEFQRVEFTAMTDALPPQSLEAEEAILGGVLMDPQAMPRLMALPFELAPHDFYDSSHSCLWQTMLKVHNAGHQTDLMEITCRLQDDQNLEKIGGTGKLVQLVDRVVSAVNIDRYAVLIKEKSIKRSIIALSYDMASMSYDQFTKIETIKRGYIEQLQALPSIDEKPEDRVRRESDHLVDKVKAILLNPEYRPHDRKLAMAKLSRSTGHAPAFLEDLFYMSQIADDNEPLMSLRELREKYGDSVESWLVHGFLNRGRTTLLHAKGGTGKSLLSYDLIYSIVHGEDWGKNAANNYGFPAIGQHKVMIIQTDESPSDLSEHLEQRGFDIDDPNVRVKTKWNIAHLPHLYQEVKEFRPDLILIDSLTSVSAKNCVSENDMEYARPILAMNAIANEFGCHILILHHSSRGAGEARGTTALEAAVSQVWKLERDNTDWASGELRERLRLFTITKARSRRPAQYRIELNTDNFRWECLGEVNVEEEPEHLTTRQHIINCLKQRPGVWLTSLEIAEITRCTLASVRRCCTKLAMDKVIQPRKTPGQRAILYRVGDPPTSDHPTPPRSVGDHLGDHFPNPDGARDAERSDQLITKNQKISTDFDAEKSKTSDHLITSSPNPDGASDTEVITEVITPPESDHLITSPRYIRAKVVNLAEEWIEINATVLGDSPGGYLIRPWDSKAAGGSELRILFSQVLGEVTP